MCEKFYQILNKETGAAACKAEDIPDKYIAQLGGTSENLKEEITFFYYQEDDLVILNTEHPDYGFYSTLVERFLGLNDANQKEAVELTKGTGLNHTMITLQTISLMRKINAGS